jgi:hypothetical protein
VHGRRPGFPRRRPAAARSPRLAASLTAAAALLFAASPSASAEIVKAPTGENSTVTVSPATMKTFKRNKLALSSSGAAKRSGSKLTMPYSLSRWDFTTREGDVAHFAKNTGFRLKRGKRSALVVHPRLVMDTPASGYITALIANERIKFFTVSGAGAKASDVGNVQQINGLKLKLTQAGANYVTRAVKRKALKRFSQFGTLDLRLIRPAGAGSGTPGQGDTPGATATAAPGFLETIPGGGALSPVAPGGSFDGDNDGHADGAAATLPLEGAEFDLDTNTGTIDLGGGLVIAAPALGTEIALVNPQVVIGATPDTSGLFADVNGVRIKVGEIDTNTLDVDVANGTVTIHGLHVTVSGALAPLLHGVLGSPTIQAGTPLLTLDLSLPQL